MAEYKVWVEADAAGPRVTIRDTTDAQAVLDELAAIMSEPGDVTFEVGVTVVGGVAPQVPPGTRQVPVSRPTPPPSRPTIGPK